MRHQGFPSDEEFIAHHKDRANNGDENSLAVVTTRSRLELGELLRESTGRAGKEEPTFDSWGPAAPDLAVYKAHSSPAPEGTGYVPE